MSFIFSPKQPNKLSDMSLPSASKKLSLSKKPKEEILLIRKDPEAQIEEELIGAEDPAKKKRKSAVPKPALSIDERGEVVYRTTKLRFTGLLSSLCVWLILLFLFGAAYDLGHHFNKLGKMLKEQEQAGMNMELVQETHSAILMSVAAKDPCERKCKGGRKQRKKGKKDKEEL